MFPGDDLALSSSEAATAATVHAALEGLGDLDRMQATLGEHWDPAFQGHIDGTDFADLAAMRQHCAALQVCVQDRGRVICAAATWSDAQTVSPAGYGTCSQRRRA